MITVQRLVLPAAVFEPLRAEAREQGYAFLERTAEEWVSGANRFDGPGEMFCGWLDGGELIATGALTADPFAGRPEVGRIRRVYVRADRRNQGMGASVVGFLLGEARKTFRGVRLREENAGAARLYERLGFVTIADPEASHALWF